MRTAPRVHVQFHHAARVRGDQLGQLRRGEFVRNHTRPFLAAPVRSRSLSSLFDVQIVYVRWRSGCLRCTACPCCAYLTQRTHSCILADCQGEAGRVRGGAARDLVGRHARRGAAAAAVRGRRAARRRHPRARRSVTSRCHCCLSFRVIRGPYVCQCGFWLSLCTTSHRCFVSPACLSARSAAHSSPVPGRAARAAGGSGAASRRASGRGGAAGGHGRARGGPGAGGAGRAVGDLARPRSHLLLVSRSAQSIPVFVIVCVLVC